MRLNNERESQRMRSALVILDDYDPTWPAKFIEEKKLLLETAKQWNQGCVEHIGSTAVPGMIAKPIIDIMFGVKSLEESRPAIDALSTCGYKYWPYKAEIMHWFLKPSADYRTHHLHLVPFESPLWLERIKFRDLLRSDQSVADEYVNLKRELAAQYKLDREAYTDKKWPFIQQVLKNC